MSYSEIILGGIGRHKLRGIDSLGRAVEYTLPLCQYQGFIPRWIPEFDLIKTTNLEIAIADIQMSEVPILKGYWAEWDHSWDSFSLDIGDAENIIAIINRQSTHTWTYWPSIDDNPDWHFPVNIIAEEIQPRPTKADIDTSGMYGFKLTVRTKDLQKSMWIPRVSTFETLMKISTGSRYNLVT